MYADFRIPIRVLREIRGLLVPKVRLGTPVLEALLRQSSNGLANNRGGETKKIFDQIKLQPTMWASWENIGSSHTEPKQMGDTDNDDWEAVWDARSDALSQVLGSGHDQVFHAPHPFALGGQADVVVFFHHLDGAVYVTAELTGKPDACYADYELMICHRSPNDWGPNIISRLAPYTQEAFIGPGETMDIDAATPAESSIKAFLFDTYATFTLFGEECELRLCIGITKAELQFKMDHGLERLLELLKRGGVYPFTDLNRQSVALLD